MRYCKAYMAKDLMKFPQWAQISNAKGQELGADDVAYVLESYQVTSNPLAMDDEADYLLNEVTSEWETFCRDVLKFEVPDWEEESKKVRASIAEAEKA